MSHIRTIEVQNIKGHTGTFHVEPLTYIHGRNRTNKTTPIDAMQWVLLGYHPKLAKRNADIFDLSSHRMQMEACVEFANGERYRRRLARDGKSFREEILPLNFAVDPRLIPALDPTSYFGESENTRVQQVIKLAEGLGDESRVPAFMAKLKNLKAKKHDEAAEKALRKLLTEMPAYVKGPVQPWMGSALEWAQGKYKVTNANVKSFDGTNQTLTTANSIDAMNEETNLATLRAEQAMIQGELDTIGKELAAAEATNSEATTIENLKATLKRQLDELREKYGEITEAAIEALRTEHTGKLAEIRELNDENANAREKRDDAQTKLGELEGSISYLEKRIIEERTRIESIKDDECCPTCKTKRKGWQDAVIKLAKATIEDLSVEMKRKQDYLAQHKTTHAAAVKMLTDNQTARDALTNEAITLREKFESMETARAHIADWTKELDKRTAPARINTTEKATKQASLEKEMQGVQEKIKRHDAQESERKRIEEVRILAADARATLELVKAMGETIKEEQAALVAGAFGPVLEVANVLTAGILPTPLDYHEGRVGRWSTGNLGIFIPVATFSGSEERLTFMAITVGLARHATHRIGVIDELGTLDEPSRRTFLMNAQAAIKSELVDQLFMLDVNPPLSLLEGMAVIST